jgi:hypothetical protein
MNWTRCWFLLILIWFVSSCGSKRIADKDFIKYRHNLSLNYCTNNLQIAKSALLADLQIMSEWQSNNIEGTDFQIDYDVCKALDHERLFLIYRKTGETNEMEHEFRQSLECLELSRRAHAKPPLPPVTEDELAKEIDMFEHNVNVRWKTNIILKTN